MKHPAKVLVVLALGIGLAGGLGALRAGEAGPAAVDVLVISGGGTPFEGIAKITPENVDAVSCPTPVGQNCRTVAEQVAEALRAKGLTVRVADAAEIRHRDEILRPRCVVLGSPCYFSNASWKMHKLFHEIFWQVHALGGDRLGGKPFATFAIGKSEPKSGETVTAMQTVVKSCQGTPGPTMVVLADHAADQVKERVAKFADEVAASAKAK